MLIPELHWYGLLCPPVSTVDLTCHDVAKTHRSNTTVYIAHGLHNQQQSSRSDRVRPCESLGAHSSSLLPTPSEVLADVFLVCLPVLLLDLIDLVLQLHDSPLNLIVLTHQRHPIGLHLSQLSPSCKLHVLALPV